MNELQNNDQDKAETERADDSPAESEASVEQLTLYKKPKRNGKYVSRLAQAEASAMQLRKAIFMYASILCFLVSLLGVKSEGRSQLIAAAENGSGLARSLATLYIIVCAVLFVTAVYVAILSRFWQRIGNEIKEKNAPAGGLDRHTFYSYEMFNALQILYAAGELALTVFGLTRLGEIRTAPILWSILDIALSAGAAVLAFFSRQVLYKANAGNLEYIHAPEGDANKEQRKSKK